jgi:Holliday junction DNA helicase RuvB
MIESDRFVASTLNEPVEESIERALRPKELQEYVGQEKVRSQLDIYFGCKK